MGNVRLINPSEPPGRSSGGPSIRIRCGRIQLSPKPAIRRMGSRGRRYAEVRATLTAHRNRIDGARAVPLKEEEPPRRAALLCAVASLNLQEEGCHSAFFASLTHVDITSSLYGIAILGTQPREHVPSIPQGRATVKLDCQGNGLASGGLDVGTLMALRSSVTAARGAISWTCRHRVGDLDPLMGHRPWQGRWAGRTWWRWMEDGEPCLGVPAVPVGESEESALSALECWMPFTRAQASVGEGHVKNCPD